MSNKNLYAYHFFKAAQDKYGRKPDDLRDFETDAAEDIARRTLFVEDRILNSQEAQSAKVRGSDISEARHAIISRYDSFCDFLADLDESGLDDAILLEAIERQLRVEKTIELVAATVNEASDEEIADFYERRRQEFVRPEQRVLSHILITINPEYPENTEAEARRRIDDLHARLKEDPKSFGQLAQLHSECPSALRSGDLGVVTPGQLMQPLEDTAFALKLGEISAPVETEAGYHIAKCDQIIAPRTVSLDDAREKIAEAITEGKRQKAQRKWIKDICAAPATAANQSLGAKRTSVSSRISEREQACAS